MSENLSLAYSTCPNDTFIFHALKEGLVKCPGIDFDIRLADVEELNQRAKKKTYHISKLSFAAIGHMQEEYGLLRTGAALGRGCGPLIVAKKDSRPEDLLSANIAIPGLGTTAGMLLELYLAEKKSGRKSLGPDSHSTSPMIFDRIMPALQNGEFEFGVIIHEGRFTFEKYGLSCVADLGSWWEKKTGCPIPLGGIAARRDLPPETISKIETAIGASVRYAFNNREASASYIREFANELDDAVIKNHIDLYVNDFSMNLGKEGEEAIELLFTKARKHGILPEGTMPVFAL